MGLTAERPQCFFLIDKVLLQMQYSWGSSPSFAVALGGGGGLSCQTSPMAGPLSWWRWWRWGWWGVFERGGILPWHGRSRPPEMRIGDALVHLRAGQVQRVCTWDACTGGTRVVPVPVRNGPAAAPTTANLPTALSIGAVVQLISRVKNELGRPGWCARVQGRCVPGDFSTKTVDISQNVVQTLQRVPSMLPKQAS